MSDYYDEYEDVINMITSDMPDFVEFWHTQQAGGIPNRDSDQLNVASYLIAAKAWGTAQLFYSRGK